MIYNEKSEEEKHNRLFSSQEISKKYQIKVDKQTQNNSIDDIFLSNNKEKKDALKLKENLNDNLALIKKNYNKQKEINSLKKNNVEVSKEDESDEVNIIINNLPLEDEWNESKINFENISLVSQDNSDENNNDNLNIIDNNILFKSENSDNINQETKKNKLLDENLEKKVLKNIIIDKNIKSNFVSNFSNNNPFKSQEKEQKNDYFDILKNEKINLEEKLEIERNINKEKSYHIEILKKALNNNILNQKNIKENKDSINIQFILEYSKCKVDNEKLKKNIIMQKILCDDMKKEIEILQKEKNELIERINKYENINNKMNKKIEEQEIKLKEKQNIEKELKKEIDTQKQLYANLNQELDLKNKKIYSLQKDINGEEELNIIKNNNNYIIDIVNDLYNNIKDISKNIKLCIEKIEKEEKNSQNNLNIVKQCLDIINSDNNGNISLNDKLSTLKEFIHFIKSKSEILFSIYELSLNKNNFDKIKIEENEEIINYSSQNGQNTFNKSEKRKINRINDYNKKYLDNKNMFKKIDLHKYKNKAIKTNYNEKNNAYNIDMKDYNMNCNNNDLISIQNSDSKNQYLQKNNVALNFNISEIGKSPMDTIINNSRTRNSNFDDLFSTVFKEKIIKKKNIHNLKVNQLDYHSNLINRFNTYSKPKKKSKLNMSEEININKIDNTTNIFPSNKKIINISERSDRILSLNSTSRKPINENEKVNDKNSLNINPNILKTNLLLNLNNTSNNHKKTISSTSTFYNNNKELNYLKDTYTLENKKTIETSNKMRKLKKTKNKLAIRMIQKELFDENNIKKNKKINGLAEEIMKPSFLKGNNNFSLTYKNQKTKEKVNKLLNEVNIRKK